jgi:hypothetical protein
MPVRPDGWQTASIRCWIVASTSPGRLCYADHAPGPVPLHELMLEFGLRRQHARRNEYTPEMEAIVRKNGRK